MLPVAHADQYPDHAKSTRTDVTVHVVWLPSFLAVNAFCSFVDHEPTTPPREDDMIKVGCFDLSSNTIYAVEPENFNDHTHLEILGHEFWHALGAIHPAI